MSALAPGVASLAAAMSEFQNTGVGEVNDAGGAPEYAPELPVEIAGTEQAPTLQPEAPTLQPGTGFLGNLFNPNNWPSFFASGASSEAPWLGARGLTVIAGLILIVVGLTFLKPVQEGVTRVAKASRLAAL